ncbi:MAG TPA: hypothetical protein VF343_08840 [Syntrophales bacterium]
MNRKGWRIEALGKAVDYEPEDSVIRHQYGVAMSKRRQCELAITSSCDELSTVSGSIRMPQKG